MGNSIAQSVFHECGHAVCAKALGLTIDFIKFKRPRPSTYIGKFRTIEEAAETTRSKILFAGPISETIYEMWATANGSGKIPVESVWFATDSCIQKVFDAFMNVPLPSCYSGPQRMQSLKRKQHTIPYNKSLNPPKVRVVSSLACTFHIPRGLATK